ncbi:DUF2567 domain-containing protein [Micromonospora sp. NPDC007271]|uniref:DUF2567 domain-containing protein n=1 Tax=Micromonospora sp. NPDC007271 TaxID=3154587 RepID=UPI00340B7D47
MSPDTPEPEQAADRPGVPGTTDRPSGSPGGGPPSAPAPDSSAPDFPVTDSPAPDAPAPDCPAPDSPAADARTADGSAAQGELPGSPPTTGRGRTVGIVLGAALVLTGLGAPLGLLWAVVAPGTPVEKTARGAIYATPQPEQPIAADGWFSVLGLGFGVLAAIALWFLLRRRRGPVGLLAGGLGGLGAAVVAWQLGRRVGLDTYHRLLATAPDGTAFTKPADLRAGGVDWYLHVLPVPYGNLLLPAFGVAVTYTLLAGWSRWPSLRPEPDGGWPPAGPELSSAPGDRPAR